MGSLRLRDQEAGPTHSALCLLHFLSSPRSDPSYNDGFHAKSTLKSKTLSQQSEEIIKLQSLNISRPRHLIKLHILTRLCLLWWTDSVQCLCTSAHTVTPNLPGRGERKMKYHHAVSIQQTASSSCIAVTLEATLTDEHHVTSPQSLSDIPHCKKSL